MKNVLNIAATALSVVAASKDFKRLKSARSGQEKFIAGTLLAFDILVAALNFKSFADGNLLPEECDEDEVEE